MAQISRLHSADIQNGLVADASHVSDELNLLVNESNAQDTRLTDAESNITSLQNDLDTANQRLDNHDSDIATLQSDVSSIDARVTQNESDISVLQSATAVGFQVVNADYVMSQSDKTVIVDPNAIADLTITLPDADSCQDGQVFRVVNAAPNITVTIGGLVGNCIAVPGSQAATVALGYGEELTAIVTNLGSAKYLAISIGSPYGRGLSAHFYLSDGDFPYTAWSSYLQADKVIFRIAGLAGSVTFTLAATAHSVACNELIISNQDDLSSVNVNGAIFWNAGAAGDITSFTIGHGETARLTPIKRGLVWNTDGVWMLERVNPW